MKENGKQSWLLALGPGILFASTAIGVSHLVQSTRAGADYGMGLIWAILLANILKYPFFEFGSRYAVGSGESLIHGYRRMGKWALGLYAVLTLCSMFFVTSAVTAVTAAFFDNLLGISATLGWSSMHISMLLVCATSLMLIAGKYSLLDSLIKVVAAVLGLSTLLAFLLCLWHGPAHVEWSALAWRPKFDGDFLFLIALMGWMPTAVDLSTWNSLWTLARMKQVKEKLSMKQVIREFNVGYWGSAVLAVMFCSMGAFLFYGGGIELSRGSASFADQVVGMYAQVLGDWSYLIIAVAAFSIMLGTAIAVFDGYGRSVSAIREAWSMDEPTGPASQWYTYAILLLALGTGFIIYMFGDSMRALVDIATTLSFLIAPFIALFNLRLVHIPYLDPEHEPSRRMRYLGYLGLVYLTGFSVLFLLR